MADSIVPASAVPFRPIAPNRKVRAGSRYIFYPVMLDRFRPSHKARLVPGDVVTVVNLPGCPKASVMGHCHVNLNGEFAGLVCTNSLYPMADRQLVIDAIKADIANAVVEVRA